MYEDKIKYFDESVNAPWSITPYGTDEIKKLDRMFAHLNSIAGQKVLEPGCGTGRLTEILADKVGKNGLVVALDMSPEMTEVARNRTKLRTNVEVHTLALEDYTLKEHMFDNIICHQVFPHFEDKNKALSLLLKELKPAGRIIIFHFISTSQINDIHRKAGTSVEKDAMPAHDEMIEIFTAIGAKVEFIIDDQLGYFLSAVKL